FDCQCDCLRFPSRWKKYFDVDYVVHSNCNYSLCSKYFPQRQYLASVMGRKLRGTSRYCHLRHGLMSLVLSSTKAFGKTTCLCHHSFMGHYGRKTLLEWL